MWNQKKKAKDTESSDQLSLEDMLKDFSSKLSDNLIKKGGGQTVEQQEQASDSE